MISLILIGLILVGVALWFFPWYGVWVAKKSGEAAFEEAQKEQMIQVSTAEGRLKAAEANKKAAIVEAEAVAEQINKIGLGLKEHDLYLKWQWIKMMEERPESSTIYVPTEANLPILESTRSLKEKLGEGEVVE